MVDRYSFIYQPMLVGFIASPFLLIVSHYQRILTFTSIILLCSGRQCNCIIHFCWFLMKCIISELLNIIQMSLLKIHIGRLASHFHCFESNLIRSYCLQSSVAGYNPMFTVFLKIQLSPFITHVYCFGSNV